jgi:hypothetical protein
LKVKRKEKGIPWLSLSWAIGIAMQHLLDLLKLDDRSTKSHPQGIKPDGQFAFPRSFYSFLSRTIFRSRFNSIIWCGTQMRIRSMELLYSAAAAKPEEIYVFTDFNYLEPTHGFKSLSMWLECF